METQIFELLKTVSTQVYNIYYYNLIIEFIHILMEPVMAILFIYVLFNVIIKFYEKLEMLNK